MKQNTIQLQNLKGFRDFLPEEKMARDWVQSKLVAVFETFGFQPLETPTLEYASLLLGKYGTEADKLVYTFADKGDRKVGLRYDQTVPTARVLTQYQGKLPKYFRRYQIQNVFRADKPQKGRYREFTQCDCDIFGAKSPIFDAELLAVCYNGLKAIGFQNIEIEFNDRQTLLETLSPFATPEVDVFSIIQSIDKLDKLSPEKVGTELIAKGLSKENSLLVLDQIESAQKSDNLLLIEQYALGLGVPAKALVFNPKLARGLDYYTGLIFEAKITEYTVGSVAGGGPYNNLIKDLSDGKTDMPATGFAFGFDRIVEAAKEQKLIPAQKSTSQVLVTIFDENLIEESLELSYKLRNAGINVELYPAADKLGKQFKLADQKQIPWIAIIGEEENKNGTVSLKNMKSGEQTVLDVQSTIDTIRGN